MQRARAWIVVGLAACGGGGGDREPTGLVTAATTAPRPIDPARAARDGSELARAVAQPWRVAAGALGDHRLTVASTAVIRDGATVLEDIRTDVVIDGAANGSFHATLTNNHDDGREVIWLAPTLYQRPRYARWHGRAPETVDEPLAVRDQLAAELGDYLAMCAAGLEVSDKGSTQVAGRSGHKLELKRAPSPRRPPPAAVTQRGWRERASVDAVSGEVTLDDELGVALAATLACELGFDRDGKALTMALTVTHTVAPLPQPTIAAPPPELVVAAPTRSREVDDRNALLRGIAPPQGKAAVDEPAPGAAP